MVVNFVCLTRTEVAIVAIDCFFTGRNARYFVMAVWILQILFMDNLNGFFFFGNSVFRLFFFACGFEFGFTLCNRFFNCRFMRFFCALNSLCFSGGSLGYFFCFGFFVNFLPFSQDFFHRLINRLVYRFFWNNVFARHFRRNGMFTGNAAYRSNAGPCNMHFGHKAVWRWWRTVKFCCLRHMHYFSRYRIFTA